MPNPVFDRMLVAPLRDEDVPLFLAGLVPTAVDDSVPTRDEYLACVGLPRYRRD